MLVTTPDFIKSLGKTYHTISFEPLDCSTNNVVYGNECTLSGLLYVGNTLRKKMKQHRSDKIGFAVQCSLSSF